MNNRERNIAKFINKYYEKLDLEKIDIEQKKITCFKTIGEIDFLCRYYDDHKKIHSISVSFKCAEQNCGVGWIINKKNRKIKRKQKVKLIIKDNYLIYKKIII